MVEKLSGGFLADPPMVEKRRAVTPRHAASLLVLRETPDGPAVLMGTRGAGHRFMPNRLVFPGGAVERPDATAAAATPLTDITRAMLEKAAKPRLAHALAIAAARELEEETGLSLGDPPALDGLHYLCRAITPPTQPVRFNARFLLVSAERVAGALAGSGELESLRFYLVDEALGLELHPVQRGALEQVRLWRAMRPEERERPRTTPLFRERRWLAE